MRGRTVSEIIASRLKVIKDRYTVKYSQNVGQSNQIANITGRLSNILNKNNLDNQDKVFLMQYIQTKCRINLDPKFPSINIGWLVIKEKTLIDKNYDCTRKSFYLFKGKLQFQEVANFQCKRQFTRLNNKRNNKQILTLENQGETGLVFSNQIISKCLVFAENAILFYLQHNSAELKLIQRNCLVTSKEKQEIVSRLSLFQSIDSLKKKYIPYFTAKKYSKGDIIYEMGQMSNYLYIIIEGEVEMLFNFQGSSAIQRPQKSALKHLRNKHINKQSLLAQKLGQGCYFGQEELINQRQRISSARCFSASCLLLIIPAEIFSKLMTVQTFAQKIRDNCIVRQKDRQGKVDNIIKIKTSPSPQAVDFVKEEYHLFKTKVFNRLEQQQKIQLRKLSLHRSKQKIMHGHTLKLPRNACKTGQGDSFSMLKVNESMYLKTLKRFRHSLKQIEEQKKPKKKVQIGQARSLEKVWHLLGLRQMFSDSDQEEGDIEVQRADGRTYYEHHLKMKNNIRNNVGLRPKGMTTNCRLKQQYLQYLQNCS